MNIPEDSRVDEHLVANLSEVVPTAVDERLRSQLADFRERLAAPNSTAADHTDHWAPRQWWGIGAAIAGVVVASAIGLVFRSSTSLAEVSTAVFAKPWIHVRITSSDGRVSEAWYSPAKGIAASQSRESIQYNDQPLRIDYSYDVREQRLYRLPDNARNPSREFESLVLAMTVLLRQKEVADNPLERFGFSSQDCAKMKVLDQRVERVREGGREWLDYRITVSQPSSTEPFRMLLRADASTKLLELCRFEASLNGKPAFREMRFSYPEQGPADIYALGVPHSAKLVDRLPAGDLKRILETVRAGRRRMDNYRAVFVSQIDGSDLWREFPTVLYRKGDWFCSEHVSGELAPATQPRPNEDLGQWWQSRLQQFRCFLPHYVMRGPMLFSSEFKKVTDPNGTIHDEITSVTKYNYNTEPGETYPIDYAMRPEFACRPPLGVGGKESEPTLDFNPADGPAGCIRLSVRQTSTRGRIDEQGSGLPDEFRFWLDPRRDDIVMRLEMVVRDGKGTEKVIHDQIVEEAAKSPQGVWYASRIRIKNVTPGGKVKSFDQIYHIYVDFSADLPDSLFEPPRPGRLD